MTLLEPTNALSQSFFARATDVVARELLGATFIKVEGDGYVLAGRIVETEAYLPDVDAANHAHRGMTTRNAAMFGEAGTLYVYRIYGLHLCVNIVTEEYGRGAAVLLRAIEPLEGLERMQARRQTVLAEKLCNGPANLAQAFGFSLLHSGTLCAAPSQTLFLLPPTDVPDVAVSARVGITKAAALPLRFYVRGSRFVSKGKPSASS
jgi:DNA-3-methyladenine glycosylase